MNAIITCYKKTVLSAMMLVLLGYNSVITAVCSPCQAAAAARESARDAAAVALSIAATIAKSMELDLSDDSQDVPRAPREALPPCSTCPQCPVSPCNQQLQGLIASEALCCAVINEKLDRQEKESAKCCRKIKHELNEIEDLIISQTDSSAACCSVIETTLGNVGNSVIDIPSCAQRFSVVDVINSTDVDVITWLKSIYRLLFEVYQCTCEPCIT